MLLLFAGIPLTLTGLTYIPVCLALFVLSFLLQQRVLRRSRMRFPIPSASFSLPWFPLRGFWPERFTPVRPRGLKGCWFSVPSC